MTMPVLYISLPSTFVYSPRHPITLVSAFYCVWGFARMVSCLHTRQFVPSEE